MKRHPGSAHLAMPRILQSEAGLDLSESVFALLEQAGFTHEQTSDIARTALQTAVMLVTQEAGAELGVPAEQRAEVAAAKHRAIASLPRDRYPHIVACADTSRPPTTTRPTTASASTCTSAASANCTAGVHAAQSPA